MPGPDRFEPMVLAMCEKHRYEEAHCQRVAGLAGELFALLADLHGLGERERALLRHGALLHDIGYVVGYRGHHRHGAYLIRHDAALAGYPAAERKVLAYLARTHRKGRVRLPAGGGRKTALKLAALLRLADGLDHERTGTARIVAAEVKAKRIILTVAGIDPVAQAGVLRRKARFVGPAFGRRLVWRAVPPS